MLNRGISIGSGLVGLGGSEADTEVCNPAKCILLVGQLTYATCELPINDSAL